jgi:hypothetical protein
MRTPMQGSKYATNKKQYKVGFHFVQTKFKLNKGTYSFFDDLHA